MDNFRKKVGARINNVIASKDVKQKDLAKAIGVTDNTISYYLSGARTPNTEQIVKIAQYLGVSTDYLLGMSDIASNEPDIQMIGEYTGLSEKSIAELHFDLRDELHSSVFEGLNSFIENERNIYFFNTFVDYCLCDNSLLVKNLDYILNGNIDSSYFDNVDNFTSEIGIYNRKLECVKVSTAKNVIKNSLFLELQQRLKTHEAKYKQGLRGGAPHADDPETR